MKLFGIIYRTIIGGGGGGGRRSYPSAEKQSVYLTVPSNWARYFLVSKCFETII